MTRDEMSKVVARILELDPDVKKFLVHFPEEYGMEAHSGASFADLQKLQGMFPGNSLPQSYRTLLELHDGIKNFKFITSSLLSAAELLAAGHDGRGEEPEKEKDRIFFILGEDWAGVSFDTTTVDPKTGEMEVAEYNNTGEVKRWKSLPDFLLNLLKRQEDRLAKGLADREGKARKEKT